MNSCCGASHRNCLKRNGRRKNGLVALNSSKVRAALEEVMQIEGAIGCALADYGSGLALGTAGTGINLDIAAAGYTEVVRAKMKVMGQLGLRDTIEDILITMGTQYHLIRVVASQETLFFYVALTRSQANLAMARLQLMQIAKSLD